MTAYELRHHLAAEHDVRMIAADYPTLLTVHDVEHRGGSDVEHRGGSDHEHDDRPASPGWAQECREFGCYGEPL